MNKYVILANPGHNRIYFNVAIKIALSELKAVTTGFDIEIEDIEIADIGLPASISVTTKNKLNEAQLKLLSSTSIYYAIFEVVKDNLLRPIVVQDFRSFPESMVQILKYNGKTNEQFTRLMVNLALAACNTTSKKITLLDPMCGKGTTLYEGFIRGLDVKGIEINSTWYQEIKTFVVRYLKEGKYKHKAQKSTRTNTKGKKIADGFNLVASNNKADYKAGNVQSFDLFNADTRISDNILGKKSCDIIVSDLPYGVQHKSKKESSSGSRSPIELVKDSIPAWYNILKTNGSIVLSFNEFTMKYNDIAQILKDNNLDVKDMEPYNNFLHRVDQSINRNIIVATKN